MKWQYLLIVCLILSCVGSVGAVRENFQEWGTNELYIYSPAGIASNSVTGQVYVGNVDGVYENLIRNINPTYFTYAAWDSSTGGILTNWMFYDSGFNLLSVFNGNKCNGRVEVKMVGMQPTVYCNGVYQYSNQIININPSYLSIGISTHDGQNIDNILIGESDPHVVGALPSNWTIIRDLINPSATGVYAWDNSTQTWVSKNSLYFYIDADTSSQQSATEEYFDIGYYNTGTTVNTTVIHNQASPRNRLQFSVSDFLNTATALGTTLPDGEYYAQFRGYPNSRAYFWVISQGASVSWNQATYPNGDPATITYAVSNSYWNTMTYTYRVDVLDTTGTVKKTQSITTQIGTVSIASLDPTTYPAGAYYAEVIATETSTGEESIMNYAAMEITDYVYLSGYVMDETGAVLSGAMVNVSQTGTNVSYTSASTGWGNNTQYWLTGSTITTTTNKTGYTPDVRSFTPLAAGNIPLNITLFSTSPSYSGAAIGGVVRDDQYGNPVVGATYHTLNGTDTICTTNIAGVCINNNLVANALYNVSGSKTGYGNSSTYQVVAVGV
jgi:hypothetical protein